MLIFYRDYTSIETARLGFLNLGPKLTNLNQPFTKLTTLYLQHNKIESLAPDCFTSMPSLKFLALQNNLIADIGLTLAYLNDLEFLDITNNKIKEIDIEEGLPSSLMFLKLRGNLFSTN